MSVSKSPKTILCTGANRGLGFQILHVGGLREPSALYILACRELSSGHQALQELRNLGVKSEIEVLQLDVTNDSQIINAVEFVKTKCGRLDGKFKFSVLRSSSIS
jgi:NAD(P)-dependent dehydrogenase (short-subunit alcohol dehydrogenase family)